MLSLFRLAAEVLGWASLVSIVVVIVWAAVKDPIR
jgi:hypothetical protein